MFTLSVNVATNAAHCETNLLAMHELRVHYTFHMSYKVHTYMYAFSIRVEVAQNHNIKKIASESM